MRALFSFRNRRDGFTLVELLIVIVVISILAAITIIAYNGITQKARGAALQTDLSQNATLLGAANAQNGAYPADQSSADLKASPDTTLTYTPDGDGYCLQASGDGQTYHITDDNTVPQTGACTVPLAVGVFTTQVPDAPNSSGASVGATLDAEHALNDGSWFPSADGYIFGMYFSANTAGKVTGVRFYKASSEATGSVGYLWNQAGTVLASVNFTGETSSGWQSASFSSPVSITANTTYMIGYSDPSSYFAFTDGGLMSAVTNGPLTTPADALNAPSWWNGDNDAFCTIGIANDYTAGDATCEDSNNLPVAGAFGANFFVDVVFTPN